MIPPRLIPTLLLQDHKIVKTRQFKKANYIGDPVNTVKLFNDLEVDEIAILDINATKKHTVDFQYLERLANESFVPMTYGGGVSTIEQIRRLFEIGFEKVLINTQALLNPTLIEQAVATFGSQSIVGSIDYRQAFLGKRRVVIRGGRESRKIDPAEYALRLQNLGCGELLLTSIDREGEFSGMDFNFIQQVCQSLDIPVIANGGCRSLDDYHRAVGQCSASAVAAGSMLVYQGQNRGILINYPSMDEMNEKFKK